VQVQEGHKGWVDGESGGEGHVDGACGRVCEKG
jgi:hypothetical protein